MSLLGRRVNWAGSSRPAGQRSWPLLHGIVPDLTSPLPTVQATQKGQVPGHQVSIPHPLAHF